MSNQKVIVLNYKADEIHLLNYKDFVLTHGSPTFSRTPLVHTDLASPIIGDDGTFYFHITIRISKISFWLSPYPLTLSYSKTFLSHPQAQ